MSDKFSCLNKSKEFPTKTEQQQRKIREALTILEAFEIPINTTPRRLERMALAFLAVCQIKPDDNWTEAKSCKDGIALQTRGIIKYLNEHYGEAISEGSYDDIRRQDLKLLVIDGIVTRSKPISNPNDPIRGYCFPIEYIKCLHSFSTANWDEELSKIKKLKVSLLQKLEKDRKKNQIPIKLSEGQEIKFSAGDHNLLQKDIIEKFLPLFGYGAKVLYVGDTIDKYAYKDTESLKKIKFFELAHQELPDVVAYSEERNWLYLIEAVYSSGEIDATRKHLLEKALEESGCTAGLIFVSAFDTVKKFRKFAATLAWETEAWIADNPDHMVHFNGDKFLGPHTLDKEE